MPKILVVDDEPAVAEMIRDHFSLRGYEVVTASDGAEGLQRFEAERPDVVMVDLKMKRLDGDEFISALRGKSSSTRVVVITGYQDERTKSRLERLGIDAFFEKPASIVDIQTRIEALTQ